MHIHTGKRIPVVFTLIISHLRYLDGFLYLTSRAQGGGGLIKRGVYFKILLDKRLKREGGLKERGLNRVLRYL